MFLEGVEKGTEISTSMCAFLVRSLAPRSQPLLRQCRGLHFTPEGKSRFCRVVPGQQPSGFVLERESRGVLMLLKQLLTNPLSLAPVLLLEVSGAPSSQAF